MIKKRLLAIVPEAGKYIAWNVFFQWLGLCSNVGMVSAIASLLNGLVTHRKPNYGVSSC